MNDLENIMSQDRFWDIIAQSLQDADCQEEQYDALAEIVAQLEDTKLFAFDYQFKKIQNQAHLSKLWACNYCVMGGASDDGFDYFKMWLISRGESVYKAALENPDSLYSELVLLENSGDICEFEGIDYTALYAYINRNGGEYNDEVSDKFYNNLAKLGGYLQNRPEIAFDWSEDEPESIRKHCPKVFDHFWENPLG